MHRHVRRSAGLLAALGAAFVSVAALGQPAGKASKNPATVEQCMEAIEEHLDGLTKQLGKPDAVKTVWEVERLALQAKSMTPQHLKGGATPETLAAYRKAQIELMKLLLQLETNVLDNKSDDAKRTIDSIEALEKDAHRKFRARREGK